MDQLQQLANLIGQAGNFIAPGISKSVKNAKSSIDLLGKMTNKEEREKMQKLSDEEKAKLFQGEFEKLKDRENAKGEAMSMLLPAGGTAKNMVVRGGQRALANAVQSAGQSAATMEPMDYSKDVPKQLEDRGKKLATDTAFGTVFGQGADVATKFVGKGLKEAGKFAFNTVFDEGKRGAENSVKQGVKSLGEEALERGETGTSKQLFSKATKKLQESEKKLQESLANSTGAVDMNDVYKAVEPQIQQWQQSGNGATAERVMQRLSDIADENGLQVPASKANEIKRALYLEADKAFGTEKATAVEGIKDIARGLKEGIEKAVPEANSINKELSYYGRIKDAMLPQVGKEARGKWLNALNVLSLAGGAVGAIPTAGMSMAAPAVTLLATSPLMQTMSGRAANAAGGLIDNPIVEKGTQLLGTDIGRQVSNSILPTTPVTPSTANQQENNKDSEKPSQGTKVHNEDNIPQKAPNANVNLDEVVTITNQQTGETKQVARRDLPQYGLNPDKTPLVEDQPQEGPSSDKIYNEMVRSYAEGDAATYKYLEGLYNMALDREDRELKQQGGKKKLPTGAIQELSDLDDSISTLTSLDTEIDAFKDKMGPIKGIAGSSNPYDSEAQIFNAQMSQAAQLIGKSLEGGKLTDADILRYRDQLPKITDTPEVAKGKIKKLEERIQAKKEQRVKSYEEYDALGSSSDLNSPVNFNQLQTGY